MKLIRALLVVSILYQLAACDAQPGLEPVIAQEVANARIDPDAALATKVEKALGIETGAMPYGVEVTAADGKVELWGTVDSNAARKRFELIAAGVVGVKSIASHLRVDPGA
jgi:osmotically-inducible protein OsmY